MGRTVGGRRGAQWAGAAALATAAVAGGVALMAAPAEEYPATDGWIREPAASKAAPQATLRGPRSRRNSPTQRRTSSVSGARCREGTDRGSVPAGRPAA
ncbi:hypothetical protein OG756_02480 [Streptomyces sp. NBC_01310]|uniref:hypothetical protein n=1 Tax=Streptomyces sp. NBC_01310 TaxID=2903820 RepID=UPI0035B68369|nr:hypothetical protein OG756_02480 [Streptomyces sp. NBC_01310]